MLQTLVDLSLTDDWQYMIDNTTVRGHVSAVGGKGGLVRRPLVATLYDFCGDYGLTFLLFSWIAGLGALLSGFAGRRGAKP